MLVHVYRITRRSRTETCKCCLSRCESHQLLPRRPTYSPQDVFNLDLQDEDLDKSEMKPVKLEVTMDYKTTRMFSMIDYLF